MTTVLLTGFGPYPEETDNPSAVIAMRLDGHSAEGVRIRSQVLPVSTNRVGEALADAIERVRPDVVLLTGVTPGRTAPAIERVAINVRDFPIADVDGVEAIDEPVVSGGPDAYFSTLPVKAILYRWRDVGLPGFVSNTAGTYLCNQIFYLARHLTNGTGVTAGLVHIPLAAHRAAVLEPPPPSASLDLLEEAVRTAAVVSATHQGADVRLPAGATC
jgi:pyroglutamyl-peptidase